MACDEWNWDDSKIGHLFVAGYFLVHKTYELVIHTEMFAQAFRVPHSLYRRYQSVLESSATAAGFAALITIILINLKVYPDNWVLVIGAAIAIIAIRWSAIAYLLAVVVLLYPIYTINLYLAVLFLAISTLGHRLFVHYLGATTINMPF